MVVCSSVSPMNSPMHTKMRDEYNAIVDKQYAQEADGQEVDAVDLISSPSSMQQQVNQSVERASDVVLISVVPPVLSPSPADSARDCCDDALSTKMDSFLGKYSLASSPTRHEKTPEEQQPTQTEEEQQQAGDQQQIDDMVALQENILQLGPTDHIMGQLEQAVAGELTVAAAEQLLTEATAAARSLLIAGNGQAAAQLQYFAVDKSETILSACREAEVQQQTSMAVQGCAAAEGAAAEGAAAEGAAAEGAAAKGAAPEGAAAEGASAELENGTGIIHAVDSNTEDHTETSAEFSHYRIEQLMRLFDFLKLSGSSLADAPEQEPSSSRETNHPNAQLVRAMHRDINHGRISRFNFAQKFEKALSRDAEAFDHLIEQITGRAQVRMMKRAGVESGTMLFDRLDTNNDGFIDRRELDAFLNVTSS